MGSLVIDLECMEPPEQARRWQERIDATFPQGVIMTAHDEGTHRTESLPVPRPEVVSLRGMDPFVVLEVPEHHRVITGHVTGWELLQEKPCTVVKVTLDTGREGEGPGEVMRWSSNVSPGAARAMTAARRQSLECSRRGELYGEGV